MNKFTRISIFIIGLFLFSYCKKDKEDIIILYDKPLSYIKSKINGNWHLIYGKGGISSNDIWKPENLFWSFEVIKKNRIMVNFNGNIYADTTIDWIWDKGSFEDGDSTYVMKYYDKRGYPYSQVIYKMYYDTLIIHDNMMDSKFYHFVKF